MIHVRLPDDFKAQLEASAKAAGRSLNSEVQHRLRASYLYEEREAQRARDNEALNDALFAEDEIEAERLAAREAEERDVIEAAIERQVNLHELSQSLDTEDLLDLFRMQIDNMRRRNTSRKDT